MKSQHRLTYWAGMAATVAGCDLIYRSVTGHGPFQNGFWRRSRARPPYGYGVKLHESGVIHKPARQLYRFLRDPRNLCGLSERLVSVDIGDTSTHWKVRNNGSHVLEWDAEVIADRKDRMIGWRTVGHSMINHAGSVRFEPMFDGQSTRVTLSLQYKPTFGIAGEGLARLFGADPASWIRDEFQRVRAFAESTDLEVLERLLTSARNMRQSA